MHLNKILTQYMKLVRMAEVFEEKNFIFINIGKKIFFILMLLDCIPSQLYLQTNNNNSKKNYFLQSYFLIFICFMLFFRFLNQCTIGNNGVAVNSNLIYL